jgi:hypothetical protein
MKDKYIEKINKELIEIINPIRNDWINFSETDLENYLKKFGNICRDETSTLRKEALSDNVLAESLLSIGNAFSNNHKILIEIVSSINNMIARYGLRVNKNIFNFLIAQTQNKKVNFYVSIFITRLNEFEEYESKWEYIMSIPKIAPVKKSINTFYHAINDRINNIPAKFKSPIKKVFESYLENNSLHESTVNKYKDVIGALK